MPYEKCGCYRWTDRQFHHTVDCILKRFARPTQSVRKEKLK